MMMTMRRRVCLQQQVVSGPRRVFGRNLLARRPLGGSSAQAAPFTKAGSSFCRHRHRLLSTTSSVQASSTSVDEEEEPIRLWDVGLSTKLAVRCDELGWVRATPVQAEVIPLALRGLDVLAQASTGTGKTMAYGLPALERGRGQSATKTLIVLPSRELVTQVLLALRRANAYADEDVKIEALYGGRPARLERRALRALATPPQIVVATPGRLCDHLASGAIDASTVNLVVVDEADQLSSVDFLQQLEQVLALVDKGSKKQEKKAAQRLFFSATLPVAVRELVARQLRKDAAVVSCGHGSDDDAEDGEDRNESNSRVSQRAVRVLGGGKELWDAKLSAMAEIIVARLADSEEQETGIVFCNTRKNAEDVAEYFENCTELRVGTLHGGHDQRGRLEALLKLRHGAVHLLVATDVASRGIDIPELKWVAHLGLPQKRATFSHRSGRVGRGLDLEVPGDSIAFLGVKELDTLTRLWGVEPEVLALPKSKSTVLAPPQWSLLRIHAGRRSGDAICAGDVLGGLTSSGVGKEQVGKIDVLERDAYVAVASSQAQKLLGDDDLRIKRKKRKLSPVT